MRSSSGWRHTAPVLPPSHHSQPHHIRLGQLPYHLGGTRHRMRDPFGREIAYVRVSVTDRCDFRCVYCMAEEMTFLPKAELLTLEELDRLCGTFVDFGVRKIRL